MVFWIDESVQKQKTKNKTSTIQVLLKRQNVKGVVLTVEDLA